MITQTATQFNGISVGTMLEAARMEHYERVKLAAANHQNGIAVFERAHKLGIDLDRIETIVDALPLHDLEAEVVRLRAENARMQAEFD